MHYHSVIHLCAHNLCSANRKERQARVMAASQGNPETENPSNRDLDHPMVEALNPEQLAKENQALKTRVRTLEAQITEMMDILQALKNGTTVEAVAIGNHEIIAALPPPGPGFNHLAHTPGVNDQNQSIVIQPPFGLSFGCTPPGAEANLDDNPTRVTKQRCLNVAGPNGTVGESQIHEGILQRTSLSPAPGIATNPQGVAYQVGNPTQFGGYYYGMSSHPQGHVFENPQSRDQYRVLEERLRAVEGTGVRTKDARDLCLVPDIVLPPKFKAPDFAKYCGTGCPSIHLTMYCRKMAAHVHNDKLLIHCFQDSLAEASLNWYMQLQPSDIHSWRDLSEAFLKQYQYNMYMAPDRVQLQNMSKGDNESFKEYAQRWRSLAAQVTPSLTEKEMVYMFLETLPSLYYDKLVGSVSSNFSDMVTIGERIEAGIRSGKISCNLIGTSKARDFPAKKSGETNAIMNKRKAPQYNPIPMSYTDLCSYLISYGLITPREMKPVQPPFPKKHNPKASCEFHSGAIGHSAENCYLLKHLVQGLIDTKQLSFTEDGGCQIRNS